MRVCVSFSYVFFLLGFGVCTYFVVTIFFFLLLLCCCLFCVSLYAYVCLLFLFFLFVGSPCSNAGCFFFVRCCTLFSLLTRVPSSLPSRGALPSCVGAVCAVGGGSGRHCSWPPPCATMMALLTDVCVFCFFFPFWLPPILIFSF
ncbi:hypothetical protein TRSC58_07205 [Trypanosoma rangeli SC58]|uniref:Uncharacterized protein n=1 Tax=Trypanosoma rangeli SC58 TaxID=429131 RepID=A0A061IS67_TRYRA|nr:hypothetical protein TRSC58_07205 [Trypanosoma rangeli SC58]